MMSPAGLSAVSALSVSSRWSPFLRLVVLPGLSAVSGLAVSLFSPSRRAGLRHRRYLSLSLVSDSGNTHDQELFSFHRDHSPCDGFEEVLNCYNVFAQLLRLSATPEQSVDDEAVYLNVAGKSSKGRVYGLGSVGRKKRRYGAPGATTSRTRGCGAAGEFDVVAEQLRKVMEFMHRRLGMDMDEIGLAQEQPPPPPPPPPPHDQRIPPQIDPVDPPQQGDNVGRETLPLPVTKKKQAAVSASTRTKITKRITKASYKNTTKSQQQHNFIPISLLLVSLVSQAIARARFSYIAAAERRKEAALSPPPLAKNNGGPKVRAMGGVALRPPHHMIAITRALGQPRQGPRGGQSHSFAAYVDGRLCPTYVQGPFGP
ncbi:hypothetical protein Scep_023674 [Stephania cephalantha]|uniref:Uncharacterized protein n=1 Tax=Stephania cephalantha TaxID=152367 RepID=A0AAP0HXM0_9MAGN